MLTRFLGQGGSDSSLAQLCEGCKLSLGSEWGICLAFGVDSDCRFQKVQMEIDFLPFDKWIEGRCERESKFYVQMQEVSQMVAPPSLMLMEWSWFFGKFSMYHFDPPLE